MNLLLKDRFKSKCHLTPSINRTAHDVPGTFFPKWLKKAVPRIYDFKVSSNDRALYDENYQGGWMALPDKRMDNFFLKTYGFEIVYVNLESAVVGCTPGYPVILACPSMPTRSIMAFSGTPPHRSTNADIFDHFLLWPFRFTPNDMMVFNRVEYEDQELAIDAAHVRRYIEMTLMGYYAKDPVGCPTGPPLHTFRPYHLTELCDRC